MMKIIRRRRSRKSKIVDTPPDEGSSSGGDSSQLENMGALETPSSRQHQQHAHQENDSKYDESAPATSMKDIVQSDDEDNEIYEDEDVSVSSGERMLQKRQHFFKAEKPMFIQDELEALRTRQLARNLRKELQAAEESRTTSIALATVDTESFFLKQNEQNKEWRKKQEDSRSYLNSYRGSADNTNDATVKKSSKKYGRAVNSPAATFEMDQFYSKQKAMKNEWKQKQRDANDLLHQYRGYADAKELHANLTFEELVAWQTQAAMIPLPDSPLAQHAKFANDNSDASVAKVPLPCLGHPSMEPEPSPALLIEKDAASVVQPDGFQGGSTSSSPLNEMGEILDDMSELLVKMEVLSYVEIDSVQTETANERPVEKKVHSELGASLSIAEAETQAEFVTVQPVTKQNGCTTDEAEESELHLIVDLNEHLITKEGDRNFDKAELEDPVFVVLKEPLTKNEDLPVGEAEEIETPIAVHFIDCFANEEDHTIEEAGEIEETKVADLNELLITKKEDRNVDADELEDPTVVTSNLPLSNEEENTAEEGEEAEAPTAVDSSNRFLKKEAPVAVHSSDRVANEEEHTLEEAKVADLDQLLITKEEDRNIENSELKGPAVVNSNESLCNEEHTAEEADGVEASIAVESSDPFPKEEGYNIEEGGEIEEAMVADLNEPLIMKEGDHNVDKAEFDTPTVVDSNESLSNGEDAPVEEAEDVESPIAVVTSDCFTKKEDHTIEAGEIEEPVVTDLDEPLITKEEDHDVDKAELEGPAVVDSNESLSNEGEYTGVESEAVKSPIAVDTSDCFAKKDHTIEEAGEVEEPMVADLDEALITKEEDRDANKAELEDSAVVASNESLSNEEDVPVEETEAPEPPVDIDSSDRFAKQEAMVADLDKVPITKEDNRNVEKAEVEDPVFVNSDVPLSNEEEYTAEEVEDAEALITVDSCDRLPKEKCQTLGRTEVSEEHMVVDLDDHLITKEEDLTVDKVDECNAPTVVDSNEPLAEVEDHAVEEDEEAAEGAASRIVLDSNESLIAKEGGGIFQGAEEVEHPSVVISNEPRTREEGEVIEEAGKLKENVFVHFDEPLPKDEEHILVKEVDKGEASMVVDLDGELPENHQAQAVVVNEFDDLLDDILDHGDLSADEPGAKVASSVTGTATNYKPEDEQSAKRATLEKSSGNLSNGGFDIEQQLPESPDVLESSQYAQLANEPTTEQQTLGISAEIGKTVSKAVKSRTKRHSGIPTPTKGMYVGTPRTVRRLNDNPSPGSTASPARRSRAVPRYGVNSPRGVTASAAASQNSPNATPRASRRSGDNSTACSTASSSRRSRGTPRYGVNSPSHLINSTVASRNVCRESHHPVSHFNSYSPGKAGVPLYRRQSSKIPQACTSKLVLELHEKHSGCERCLHFASPSARRKYDEEGHHYRINMVRGGCCRKCKLFPREENEPAVRLCRQCFYDTHRHGKL